MPREPRVFNDAFDSIFMSLLFGYLISPNRNYVSRLNESNNGSRKYNSQINEGNCDIKITQQSLNYVNLYRIIRLYVHITGFTGKC